MSQRNYPVAPRAGAWIETTIGKTSGGANLFDTTEKINDSGWGGVAGYKETKTFEIKSIPELNCSIGFNLPLNKDETVSTGIMLTGYLPVTQKTTYTDNVDYYFETDETKKTTISDEKKAYREALSFYIDAHKEDGMGIKFSGGVLLTTIDNKNHFSPIFSLSLYKNFTFELKSKVKIVPEEAPKAE